MTDKIILLGPTPPPHGGVATYVTALYESLKDRGVRLWTYGDEEFEGANVSYVRDKRFGILPLLVKGAHRARILDCTHFLFEYPSPLVPAWVVLKGLLRFKWIKVLHDGTLPARHAAFAPLKRLLFELSLGSVSEFVVASEELRTWLRHDLGVSQKVSLIKTLLPIPVAEFDAPPPADAEMVLTNYLRARKRVCSVGVFSTLYGFKHVADAVDEIRRETGQEIGLVLLDAAFVRDEEYESEVLRGRDWITVLRNVSHPGVLQIMKRSDVFVRAFGQDSYGLSRVEAIWCGLPVVATTSGETRGMMLYDYGDMAGLTRQLKRALFDPPAPDARRWADRYRREAEENLREIKTTLGLS
jgi:glycosyltransferase involved in cell wall biosynthesis